MKVLLFGRLRDAAGWRERDLDPAPATLVSLRELLARLDADLGAALAGPGVQVAIDKVLTRGDASLAGAAEVAFMPPMSGG